MGLSIATRESGPYPRTITLTLSCDSSTDILCRGFEDFTSPDGFIVCRLAAMKAGWLERHGPEGPIWLCPRCSGKTS